MKKKTQRKYDFFYELKWIKLKEGLTLDSYTDSDNKVRIRWRDLVYDYYPQAQKLHKHKENKWIDVEVIKFMVAISDPYVYDYDKV